MNDVTVRFLQDIANRVGAETVVEVHLFPAIRQGLVETGVAVIAAMPVHGESGQRHTVYSAHYRNTIKGPDRGGWEMDVHAEADAPLLTVDAVVKGVVRRAGEPFEPERISAAAFRTIAGVPDPSPTADETAPSAVAAPAGDQIGGLAAADPASVVEQSPDPV